ncbi:MAG: DUF2442 domain-containing protein [Victivallales bacterium]
MIFYLKTAEYLENYTFLLEFNTGEKGVVNLREILLDESGAFSELFRKNLGEVKNFHLDSWPTLAWDNGFDICPDVLYEKFKAQVSVSKV